uniref:Uncharacterized protein n=1 Tax=Oryza sativa subsp. japonica TaxID=39947 RepID=Q6YYH7_ORYSJ|nr:unknown protein [Oryza sativa Japonica Group]
MEKVESSDVGQRLGDVRSKQKRKSIQFFTLMLPKLERHSAFFNLAGCGFEEEGYPVVDYESTLQTAKSTTVR